LGEEKLDDKYVEDDIDIEENKVLKAFCCSRRQIIKKLVTKEDPIYLHKTLGSFALISFFYRYGYCYSTYGNLQFEGTCFDHLTMALHLALSCSSIIFEVLQRRIVRKPLIIWHEYRLHAMVFTLRSISTYLFGLYFSKMMDDTPIARLI